MFEEAQSDPKLAKKTFDLQEPRLRTALLNAQYALLNRADRTLLVVVAGIAGSGKGDTVNLMNEWMDPRHILTLAFDTPTAEEAQYPRYWRYWNALPAKGRIGIVFGSWYAPLLKEAARKRPNAERISQEVEHIRRFEAELAANGVQIVKLWYHLSAAAQAERTRALLSSPETAWQVVPEDRKVPKKYDRLRSAGMTAIERTDLPHAPWTIVPSADAQLRHLRTAQTLLAALRRRQAPRPARAGALAADKPAAEFEGRMYVQERWLKADVALIKAELADRMGNLTYRKAARNFSPLMATAARHTVVQARKVVEPGAIDPEQVITPGIFVAAIVEVADPQQEEALIRAGVAYR